MSKCQPRGRGRPRSFSPPELLQAAFMAGQGRTGGEIAAHLGGTTGQRVRARLRKAGVLMASHSREGILLKVVLSRSATEAIGAIADKRDLSPEELAADVLRLLAREPVLLENLLSED